MASLTEEGFRFFDALEDPASISGATSDGVDVVDSRSSVNNSTTTSPPYDLWLKSPKSVDERRRMFLTWMGGRVEQNATQNSVVFCGSEWEIDRFKQSNGAVLRLSGFEDEFLSPRSNISCGSIDELDSNEKFICRDRNFDGGKSCSVDEHDRQINESSEADLGCSASTVKSEKTSGFTSSFRRVILKKIEEPNHSIYTLKTAKKGWLSRLRSITCSVDKQREAEILTHDDDDAYKVQRVKVRQHGKRIRELSALYKGQDIKAHEGSILTMKFSPDGRYLASAGEDGIVRVWQVLEDERSNELDVPEFDPSCIYFTVNHKSELKPLFVDKEKAGKLKSMRKTSDSACVIFPPKVFRLLEKPLHEFHGHSGEILDLSWSKNCHLLSASVDKTVRLWQVQNDHCLGVFSHSNYVTCVHFNPEDDNYFMTGSIDGKVRIWSISSCQVVDWTVIKDVVTAVCYRPDGKGAVVGSMEGNCRFYNLSDSHLQLDAEVSLHSKKKSACKKITGFQFCPQDSTKVMVISADSQVRILQGLNVISKYRGPKSAVNPTLGCFTSDGKHIISAFEDSNVYVWNCISQEEPSPFQAKNIRSWERFYANASVAVPWWGLKDEHSESEWGLDLPKDDSTGIPQFCSPTCFSLSQEYVLESSPKCSATWPEEKLPSSSSSSTSSSLSMNRSDYKFLKASCQSTVKSHAWGLVIVTAGWDGRIRSFHNYGLPVMV
ncbi:hypothetical protein K2173_026760 [Erythroxylum novogranatense]|uniref:Uncharacterized protein n=1 Tax=Erythroxylum novogranatense TaxID=1862640 RepID=A0AAV8TXH0_9ROSI|nr:hypothetical protein K2173_026760 [Erythroxylum novogranatense]